MSNLNSLIYLDKLSLLTEDELYVEIVKICKQAKLKPGYFTLFRETGGTSFVIEKIADEIYLSSKEIDPNIRMKLTVINISVKTCESFWTIYDLNRMLKEKKLKSWDKDKYIKDKDRSISKIKIKLEELFKN